MSINSDKLIKTEFQQCKPPCPTNRSRYNLGICLLFPASMDNETCACVTLGTNTNRATGWMNEEELNPHRNTIALPRRTFVKLGDKGGLTKRIIVNIIIFAQWSRKLLFK